MPGPPKRVLIVTSVGGHLTEVMRLAPLLEGHHVTLVVNEEARVPDYPFAAVYRIVHAERDWRVAFNFAEAARILEAERPDVLLSTGAGPVVPFAVLSRLAMRTRVVFVETAAAVREPTLTGRLMHPLAHDLFYQWPDLAQALERGRLSRIVFG